MFFSKYFKQTKSPIYSLISILPLFLIYELGITLISSDELPIIRNGADVVIRNLLIKIGITEIYGIAVALLVGIGFIYYINKGKLKGTQLKTSFFLTMIFESLIWAVALSILLSQGQLLLEKENTRLVFQQIVLSIGSGLFEEFLFRVILVGGLALLIGLFVKNSYWQKMSIAIFIAASIFSYFHFVGEFASEFTLNIFFFRFLAGIFLGYLYTVRGFGIVAYTHSFYNLLVLTQIQSTI